MKGRGSAYNPQIRFEQLRWEPLEDEWQHEDGERKFPTQYFRDTTKTILAKNDSPDLAFTYDLNPYRGCEHGCVYCYARPTHEYLGFSAGLDFETKILIKEEAPELLEKEFQKRSWKPAPIVLSGNVDCYQPIERKLQITRRCLEVFLRYRNPVAIVTKNSLVLRDLDILSQLADMHLVSVCLSITTLDRDLARRMEPRTSSPEQRLLAVEQLTKNGVPSGVNVAPVIPGLTDEEIPAILSGAAARGAIFAGYTMLRLPYAVKEIFVDWLKREFPEKAHRILNRIYDVREGKLNDPQFGSRMRGTGEIAGAIERLFDLSCAKYGLNKKHVHVVTEKFVQAGMNQEELFS